MLTDVVIALRVLAVAVPQAIIRALVIVVSITELLLVHVVQQLQVLLVAHILLHLHLQGRTQQHLRAPVRAVHIAHHRAQDRAVLTAHLRQHEVHLVHLAARIVRRVPLQVPHLCHLLVLLHLHLQVAHQVVQVVRVVPEVAQALHLAVVRVDNLCELY